MQSRKFLTSITALAAALVFTGQLSAATYTQDFTGFADGTFDLGDGSIMAGTANVQGEQLELTRDGVAGGFASFSIPALANSSLGWTATFDLTIIDSAAANPPADGLSFNYGNATLGELGSAEEGMDGVGAVTENISFEIDTWMNTDLEQGVNIGQKSAGVPSDLAFTNGPILLDGTTVTGEVAISYDPITGVSFSTTGLNTNAEFVFIPTDVVGDDAYTFILSSRVGGANETVLIDNLLIETGAPGDTDGDGLSDVYENANMLDPDDDGTTGETSPGAKDGPDGADGDPDMDTLTNAQERDLGTHPQEADTDMDGLDDNVENNTGTWGGLMATGTDPLSDDSDGDTLKDGVENPDLPFVDADQPGTDPNIADTDNDTISDGAEVVAGRDPTVAQSIPSGYVQNFDGFADGITDLMDGSQMNGTAKIVDGKLQLTQDGIAGGFSSFMIPAIANSETGWTATFDLTIIDGAGTNEPADGLSFNYGNFELSELGSAEEGMGAIAAVSENISFEIDTWMNQDAEQGVNIAEKVSGLDTNLAFTNGPILLDGTTVTSPVICVYDPVEGLSFTTEGLNTDALFENVVTSFVGEEIYNFGISARVGGANQTVQIDNLLIQVGAALDTFRIISIEQVVVPGEGGNPDTLSVTVIWNSKDGRTYGIYASPDNRPIILQQWNELDDSVPATVGGETTSYTEIGIPIGTQRRFYRVLDTTNP
ncbi:MAG: hypothetical protein ACI9UA_005284 [Pseudoalteromonas tetraodonis]|jgi:hypothetical protein